jgi:TolB-like protein
MASALPSSSLHRTRNARAAVRFIAILLAVLLLSQPTLAYEQEVKQLSAQMAEAIAKSGKKTVAVVDFTDLQGNVTELGRFLAEELSTDLATAAKDFEVIDRTHLKSLLQEYKLASTGIIDPQSAKKLGEIAGVQALVTGSITPFGDSVRLSAKVLDVSTARMIGGFSADIPRTKAVEELLAKGINSSGAGAPSTASQSPASPSGTPASSSPECETQARQSQPSRQQLKPSYTLAEYNAYKDADAEQNPQQKVIKLDAFVEQYTNSTLLPYIYRDTSRRISAPELR